MDASESKTFTGTIKSYGYVNEINECGFLLDSEDKVFLRNHKGTKVNRFEYIDKTVNYEIEKMIGDYKYGRIITDTDLVDSLCCSKDWLYTGKILKINNSGAVVEIDNANYFIKNADVFRDNGKILDYFVPGNMLYNIELLDNENIYKKKAKLKYGYFSNDFAKKVSMYVEPGDEYEGIIETLNPTCCAVKILNNVRVLCKVPDYIYDHIGDSCEIGDRVLVKVTSIKKGKKYKGAIIEKI